MSDVIAFDFDGVLANTNIFKRKWLYDYTKELFQNVDKTSIYQKLSKKYSPSDINIIYQKMGQFVFTKEKLLKTKMMDQDLPYYLDILYQKYDLIIITNRPEYMLNWVHEWLLNNKIDKYFSRVISSTNDSKSNIAIQNNASILVDDDIRHLNNSIVTHNILFNGDANNWKELIDYILNLNKCKIM